MAMKYKNNATSVIAASLLPGDVVIQVSAGTGALFPVAALGDGDMFPLTLVDALGNREIVLATSRSGDLITVDRAQEGTAARSFPAGSRVELRLTARTLNDIIDALAAHSDAIATKAPIDSPDFTGTPLIETTPGIRDNTLKIASTAYADRAAAQYRGIGEIVFVSGSTLPPGCIWANGQAVSRETYANYFADVGTTYGAGNGTTTFNVPDYNERLLIGRRAAGTQLMNPSFVGGNSNVLGVKFGAPNGAFSIARTHLPATTIPVTVDAAGAHDHDVVIPTASVFFAQTASGANVPNRTNGSTSTAPNHSHSARTETLGSGVPVNIMPPVAVCNIAIFVGVF